MTQRRFEVDQAAFDAFLSEHTPPNSADTVPRGTVSPPPDYAYEEGARAFDSSMGGLGGCPFAPGASGNVVTEDLVFMFESMGLSTGVDFDALLRAREILVNGIPEEPVYGHFAGAGLPKGFRRAAGASA